MHETSAFLCVERYQRNIVTAGCPFLPLVKRPLRYSIITCFAAVYFNLAGHNMPNLFNLRLPVVISINND